AAFALGQIGHEPQALCQTLVGMLSDGEPSVSSTAADALVAIGAAAVPAVCQATQSENPKVRRQALLILRRIHTTEAIAITAVRRLLADDDDSVREQAYKNLVAMNAITVEEFIRALRDENRSIVVAATKCRVSKFGKEATAVVPELARLIEGDDAMLRGWAIRNVDELGPLARSAVPSLIQALDDESGSTRAAAVRALVNVGAEPDVMVPLLTRILAEINPSQSGAHSVAWAAARALLRLKPNAAKATVPMLVERLQDKDADIRQLAAWTLSGLGPDADAAVPALVEALQDDDVMVAWTAASALGKIGSKASPAVPGLIRALKHLNGSVREFAAVALGKIGPAAKAAVPHLLKVVTDQAKRSRVQDVGEMAVHRVQDVGEMAVHALGEIGPGAKQAIPVLIELVRGVGLFAPSNLLPIRKEALEALGKIGTGNRDALAAIHVALGDESAEFRGSAVWALIDIGSDPQAAVPALTQAMQDEHPYVRAVAALALGRIGSTHKSVVEVLIEALDDENHYVRTSAAQSLGQIGPRAKSAVPALLAAAGDRGNVPLNLTLYLSFRCCLSCGTDGCRRPINLWSLETVEKRGRHFRTLHNARSHRFPVPVEHVLRFHVGAGSEQFHAEGPYTVTSARVPRQVTLHLDEPCVLGKVFLDQRHVPVDHPALVFVLAFRRQVLKRRVENPRLAHRRPADHHRFAAGCGLHIAGVRHRLHIAIAGDGNIHGVNHLGDHVPF
ncbi:MAG: HEAT repeat domain-containing protein, partial [Chloroflexi bacterium]|nr:HEAT repeat domain-containing protein [Chloroflexota bacterium]